jgi:PhnB protein
MDNPTESETLQSATPYLGVRNAARAIEWYQRALGATEQLRLTEPDGRIGHAELHIGDSTFYLADEFPEIDAVGPETRGGCSIILSLYVEDVDALYERATAAGAEVIFPLATQFYGDRGARIRDPFGHMWIMATHVEDVDDEEMQRRMAAYVEEQARASTVRPEPVEG